MAELLVRVVDKVNADDFYLDCQCTKRGDVIAVVPDGWDWGREERANPEWTILSVPDMSVGEAQMLVSAEPAQALAPSRTLQRRAFGLDLDGLDAARLDAAQIRAHMIRKASIADPLVIGGASETIG